MAAKQVAALGAFAKGLKQAAIMNDSGVYLTEGDVFPPPSPVKKPVIMVLVFQAVWRNFVLRNVKVVGVMIYGVIDG